MARRIKKQAEETRKKIVEAAIKAFSEKDFSKLTVVGIAESIGMTKGAVYWHFKGKNDILLHIIEESVKDAEEHLMRFLEQPRTYEDIKNFCKTSLERPLYDDNCKKIVKLLLKRHEWPQELRDKVNTVFVNLMTRQKDIVEKYLTEEQNAGRIKKDISASEAALAFVYLYQGLFTLQMFDVLPKQIVEGTNIVFDATRSAICCDKDYAAEASL